MMSSSPIKFTKMVPIETDNQVSQIETPKQAVRKDEGKKLVKQKVKMSFFIF